MLLYSIVRKGERLPPYLAWNRRYSLGGVDVCW